MGIELGFRGKLEEAILLLQSMSSNDCGDLSRAQSALLHNALQMLRDLEDDYADVEQVAP